MTGAGPILFAHDGSDESRRALELAAGGLVPGPALVACVWESVSTMSVRLISPLTAGFGDDVVQELDTGARTAAERIAAEGAELLAARGFDARGEAVAASQRPGRRDEDSVAGALLELADERDARLIVLGSRGRGAARGLLLGSVSYALVHRSQRPLFVVPTGSRPGPRPSTGSTVTGGGPVG